MTKRKKKLSAGDIDDIMRLYHHEYAPNGKRYSISMLARFFRVSEATISKVLNHKYT